MKELGTNLAQLIFVIILMVTLAVSTAALSQWASSDASADGGQIEQSAATVAPALSASATR
jgi:flagellar basal body-associated protein FliL